MSDEIRVSVTLPTDSKGMLGRECPHCKKYFKIKPGTGLKTLNLTCPYCEHIGASRKFATENQIEYAKSVAVNQTLAPFFRELEGSLRGLEHSSRGSFITFKVEISGFEFPIQYYTEKDLETEVICDSCGLVFAIYGVFACCPDCSRLTSMSIFRKSLEASRKRLDVISKLRADETEIKEVILMDALVAGVSSFDSLGKRLAIEFPAFIPDKPRNLFQNLGALQEKLSRTLSIQISNLITKDEYTRLYYMFQVRHISSHNFGEIDKEFVRKTNCDPSLIGSRPVVVKEDLIEFLATIEKLGVALRAKL